MVPTSIATNSVFRGSVANFLPEAQAIRFSPTIASVSNRSTRLFRRKGRSEGRIFANARECAERGAETASNGSINVSGAHSIPKYVQSEMVALPASLQALPASLQADESACGEQWQELLVLRANGLADLSMREAFASSGEITEAGMERLVESSMQEEGQSMEDYRQRAIMFGKIAEFFKEGRPYSGSVEESLTGTTEIARTMQVIVDIVLAGNGRSASDYNCRAQLFAKSAEVFPFNNELRSS